MKQNSARRSQSQRSDEMRKRLIKATIECLAEQGYSGTTLSGVVRQAGVSRGAQVHHFSSKNELIVAAARVLLANVYRQLGRVLLDIADEGNRLHSLVFAAWKLIFNHSTAVAYNELLIASRHDPILADQLRELTRDVTNSINGPINHYFERRRADSEHPVEMLRMMVIYFAGLGATNILLDEAEIHQHIELIYRLMNEHMQARKNVTHPPTQQPALSK